MLGTIFSVDLTQWFAKPCSKPDVLVLPGDLPDHAHSGTLSGPSESGEWGPVTYILTKPPSESYLRQSVRPQKEPVQNVASEKEVYIISTLLVSLKD